MFDTLFIITLFFLAALLAFFTYCKTLRLSISVKHLSLFAFITDINGLFEIPIHTPTPPLPPPVY